MHSFSVYELRIDVSHFIRIATVTFLIPRRMDKCDGTHNVADDINVSEGNAEETSLARLYGVSRTFTLFDNEPIGEMGRVQVAVP